MRLVALLLCCFPLVMLSATAFAALDTADGSSASASGASPPGSASRTVFKVVTLVLNVVGPGGAAVAWIAARRRTNRAADLDALKAELDIRAQLAEKKETLGAAEAARVGAVLNHVAIPERLKGGKQSGFFGVFVACAVASALCFVLWFWQENDGDPSAQNWWWMLVPAGGLAFLSLAALMNALEGRRLMVR